MKKILCFSILIFVVVISLNAQTSAYYKIADKIHLEGDVVWDYLNVDASTGLLFVSNNNQVHIIDTKTNKKVGLIPNTKGVHGIAVNPVLNKAYTSNGTDTSVTIINLTTLSVIKKLKVTGKTPDAILYDPFSQNVFCFNASGKNATVINSIADTIVTTIALNGKPETGVSDNNGFIYVNINDSNCIRMINSTTFQIVKRLSLNSGTGPKGLAIDIVNQKLFSTCSNSVMKILSTVDGSMITSIPIGASVDGVAFDSGLNRIYCSSSDGAMTVVQEYPNNTFLILENTLTQSGAGTVTVNSVNHHVYVLCAEYEPSSKPSSRNPRTRPTPKPNSFTVLDFVPL